MGSRRESDKEQPLAINQAKSVSRGAPVLARADAYVPTWIYARQRAE